MQVTLAAQINYNAPHQKLNLVIYPDFFEGDQDSIIWLDEIEKAFAANLKLEEEELEEETLEQLIKEEIGKEEKVNNPSE
ncbi:12158_t:CDS:2, partial [Racocetra fulgida]